VALQKTRVIVDDNGGKAQSVFEHNVVKIGTPVLGILLLSIVTWLFTTVLELDEIIQQHTIHLQHLHEAEEKFEDQMEDLEEILTDLRVHVGRLTAH
jgi:hypothetical protein|tara:strand:- start:1 stop:291 length:291 start_codon:yes stop_codon:yes gene_type:complete